MRLNRLSIFLSIAVASLFSCLTAASTRADIVIPPPSTGALACAYHSASGDRGCNDSNYAAFSGDVGGDTGTSFAGASASKVKGYAQAFAGLMIEPNGNLCCGGIASASATVTYLLVDKKTGKPLLD
jgi:hypothetical protein